MFQLLRSAAIVSGGKCCQCEVSKHGEESFDVSAAAFDEGIDINDFDDLEKGIREVAPSELPNLLSQNGHSISKSAQACKASTQSADDGNRSGQAATPPCSNSSGSPRMDDEESLAQKARLNALVKAFTRESLLGVDCKIFRKSSSSASYENIPAKFFLDKAMTKMVVHGCGKKMSIPLINVVEAYLHEDLTEHFPDSQLGKNLREEDRSRAVFIQHQASGSSESWLCLVVADETTQERFVTGLNILRLYAEANKQTSL
jgi:hypothetical protein